MMIVFGRLSSTMPATKTKGHRHKGKNAVIAAHAGHEKASIASLAPRSGQDLLHHHRNFFSLRSRAAPAWPAIRAELEHDLGQVAQAETLDQHHLDPARRARQVLVLGTGPC